MQIPKLLKLPLALLLALAIFVSIMILIIVLAAITSVISEGITPIIVMVASVLYLTWVIFERL